VDSDERFYEAVVREIETQGPRKGLWAKAYAEAGGNESGARAIYIRLRAGQLMDEQRQELAEAERARRQSERLRRKETQSFAPRDPRFFEADPTAPINKRVVVAFAVVFLVVMAGLVIYFASSVK